MSLQPRSHRSRVATRVLSECEKWERLQRSLAAVIGAAVNILDRLQHMRTSSFLQEVAANHGATEQLTVGKQVKALEDILLGANEKMLELQEVVLACGRVAEDARQQLLRSASGKPPSATAASSTQNGQLSALQLVESIEDVRRMFADELALKAAVMNRVGYTTPADELQVLLRVLKDQPNVDMGRLCNLCHIWAVEAEE